MKNGSVTLLVLFLAFPFFSFSQDTTDSRSLDFQLKPNDPIRSITKENLNKAQTLVDLDRFYRPSWVKKYNSVEIITSHNGEIRKTVGLSDTLNMEQKLAMSKADFGSEISVNVYYIPENNLEENTAQVFDFKFKVNPDNDAQFPGGKDKLNQYLKEHAIDKIPENTFVKYDLAVVKFTLNEAGLIENLHVFESSKNEEIDELLLTTISSMPCWTPAQYANGTKEKQDFVLTVGNTQNCMYHTLNLRED